MKEKKLWLSHDYSLEFMQRACMRGNLCFCVLEIHKNDMFCVSSIQDDEGQMLQQIRARFTYAQSVQRVWWLTWLVHMCVQAPWQKRSNPNAKRRLKRSPPLRHPRHKSFVVWAWESPRNRRIGMPISKWIMKIQYEELLRNIICIGKHATRIWRKLVDFG